LKNSFPDGFLECYLLPGNLKDNLKYWIAWRDFQKGIDSSLVNAVKETSGGDAKRLKWRKK
jgi:hypothetical protein